MEKKFIQSLGRGMDILEYLAIHPKSRLQDISEQLALNKSTLHSLISTLEQLGYVEKNRESPLYSLGVKVFQLGKVYEKEFEIKRIVHPLLKKLSDYSGETTYFTLQTGESYIYIDKYQSRKNLRLDPETGVEESINCNSAIGKIFKNYLNGTPLIYAVDLEEVEEGMNCVAFPLLKRGRLLGVIGIGGPSSRFTIEKIASCREEYYKMIEDMQN